MPSDLLGLIHTNVCGPFRTMTRSSERYFITFIDDFSRFGYVYLMNTNMKLLKSSKYSKRNHTSLPHSFWGYALETVARIVNMVPTKKDFIMNKASRSPIDLQEIRETQPIVENNTPPDTMEPETVIQMPNGTPTVRRSSRPRQELDRYGFFILEEEVFLVDQCEPTIFMAATADPLSDKWLEAMRAEI
ncbi:hypothetical protein L2E82_04358 [Cichorium intybus]|uniref:Uncharacterized protein n=1 Tax=Cichorium intybus TaxID=13427 RepID=A0ACB9H5W9_CICIN|nr:hypothetical protein L2E82_04358 [Cichorium intybus]